MSDPVCVIATTTVVAPLMMNRMIVITDSRIMDNEVAPVMNSERAPRHEIDNGVVRLSKTPSVERIVGTASSKATVTMRVRNHSTNNNEDRDLPDVYYVEGTQTSLMPLDYMQTKGKFMLRPNKDQSVLWLAKLGTMLTFGNVDGFAQATAFAVGVMQMEASCQLWHQRLNHISFDATEAMNKHGIVESVTIDNTDTIAYDCDEKNDLRKGPKRETQPLSKISVDICSSGTVWKNTMFLLMVNEATRYKWTFVLKTKKDAAHHIQVQLSRRSKRLEGKCPVKVLHSDQGGEFLGMELRVWCESQRIKQRFTNAYSPEENAIVAQDPDDVECYWTTRHAMGEAIQHVIDTHNVSPTKGLHGATPHSELFGECPDVSGGACRMHTSTHNDTHRRRSSWQELSHVCSLAIPTTQKGTKRWPFQVAAFRLIVSAGMAKSEWCPRVFKLVSSERSPCSNVQIEQTVRHGEQDTAQVGTDCMACGYDSSARQASQADDHATRQDVAHPRDELQDSVEAEADEDVARPFQPASPNGTGGKHVKFDDQSIRSGRKRHASRRYDDYVLVGLLAGEVPVPKTYDEAKASRYRREWELAIQSETLTPYRSTARGDWFPEAQRAAIW
ncbi:TPA: LOW QUALITY PROTEIN: hypothetical protein N0F65_002351 [Lagenidium giganteum]|uniref:Integrase catalytic domain-containing protein n=1 Tax=Lagenidium giganteum TaxID=4803 RepID=A0AAV2Z4J6_9STRA|nr:TPA: LOW QUALITY PROTEIN: hypothetical protein N0F65_002351 [Lagenidium giganteum]